MRWIASCATLCVAFGLASGTVDAGVREDCLQDKDQALAAKACPLYEAELAKQEKKKAAPARASDQGSTPEQFFDQDWRLNPANSRLSLTTVKQKTVSETHKFTTLNGHISPNGEARVVIDLASFDTNIDIRNVRMRFLFFETFKFPDAVVTAKLDKAGLQDLVANKPVNHTLDFTLDLHGVKKSISALVTITRLTTNAVSVSTQNPIVIEAADFGLMAGIARLSKAAGGFEIKPSASITFDLVFEGTNHNPKLEAVITAAADTRARQKARTLTSKECETRMEVISKTRHIYFRSGSAEIDQSESSPVLKEVAQFTKRCRDVAIRISGHTDTDGGKAFNQKLSERRALAVADALSERGIDAKRMTTIGYGYSRPVADNNTSEGKAENRRIEFHRGDKSTTSK
jgi:OmpA-OmpF porin, OOP family